MRERHLLAIGAAAIALSTGGSPFAGAIAHGQAPAAAAPAAFEVASVKPNKSGDNRVMFSIQPGGRFTASNVQVRQLIANAYDMQMFRIEGGPAWIGSERYDIQAKAEGATELTRDRLAPMLRALLADRFKLAAHTEKRELPVYALVLARGDGTLGPNAAPSAVDCAAMFAGRRGGGPPPAPPQPGERIQCGMRIGPASIEAGGVPMAEIARVLSQQVGRVVIDRTNVTGNVDLKLEFAPDFQGRGGPPDAPGGAAPPSPGDAPSLFTALQEQAGLKLESQRAPVEVLVIDGIERPTED
jgi:uncharacterized protein (TIGR03435 family)